MAELDDRLVHDLARLRQRWDPPPGAEQHVRAALDAAIGAGPGGGDDGGSGLGDGGLGSGALGGSVSKLALGLKVIAATTVVSSAVVLVVNLGVLPAKQAREPAVPAVAGEVVDPSNVEPRLIVQPRGNTPEPPILITPPVHVQRPTKLAEDPLSAEVTLLEQARATDDPPARLQLLEQHRERFKAGIFALERDSLRVTTLCELGQIPAARQAAEEFVLAHPRSPLLLRMRNACPELDILAGEHQ